MSQSQEPEVYDTVGNRQITKRGFMRGLATTAGAATVGAAGIRSQSQTADAISLTELGATSIVGGPIALAWLMRDYVPFADDSPPEGLTADALIEDVQQTATARKSTNQSTLIDNQNIIDSGLSNTAYTEGKISGIDALNNGETQTSVNDSASTEAMSYTTTIVKNFLKSWNESVREMMSMVSTLQSHPDNITVTSHLDAIMDNGGSQYGGVPSTLSTNVTMPDGTTFEVLQVQTDGGNQEYSPVGSSTTSDDGMYVETNSGERYLREADWQPVYDELISVSDSVSNGLTTWVDTVYSQVQSGEIETADLLTPREQAQLSADSDDQFNQAIADLVALNQPVDPDNLATIVIPAVDATLRGTFAVSDDTTTLEAGNTYDPETDITGSVYFTYDISEGSGDWTAYNLGVDGGVVTFTSEPYEGVEYQINTKAGETVTATAANFTNDGTGNWEADLSTELENSITEVESVDYFPDETETRYETIQLRNSFEVVSFEDPDGNDVQSANFERASEPHDDTNYITQEEFEDQQQRTQELIDKYEESQSGGLLGGSFNLGSIGTNGGIIAAIAAVLVGYGVISD